MKKLFLIVLLTSIAFTAFAAYKTIYEIPVVVNVVGTVSNEDIKAAVDKANEILSQAGVRLSVVHTQPMTVGDGNNNITGDEADGDATAKGNAELKKHCGGENKGIKLYFVDGQLLDPTTTGYKPPGANIGLVKKDSDPNGMGSDIAHEVAHILGVDEDYSNESHPEYDNNLMGYGGGSVIRPDQARRIRAKAKNLGKKVKAAPPAAAPANVALPPNPGRQIVTPTGYNKFDPNMIDYYPPPSDYITAEILSKGINITNTQGSNNPDKDEQDDDSIVKFEIYPEGLLLHAPEMSAGWSMRDIKYMIDLVAPSTGATANITVDILDSGTEFIPTATWTDIHGVVPLESIEMRLINRCSLNDISGVGGELVPACYALFVNVSEVLVQQAGLNLVQVDVDITSQAFIEGPSPDDSIEITKQISASMESPQTKPDFSTGISLANDGTDYILYGHGLHPTAEFEVRIDSMPAGLAAADAEGNLEFTIPSGGSGDGILLPNSYHQLTFAEKPTISLPTGQEVFWTTFDMITAEPVEGDVNYDGTVNIADFHIIAENWFSGMAYE